ncbi:MAG: diphthamide biosynthesis enzyme Dph2 [Candidatus Aenigmatarchaeota archaeon]
MREKILEYIREGDFNKVFVQMPEGLLRKAPKLSDFLSEENIESVISLEPCYGACDVREEDAKKLDCDLIIHLGHSDFGVETDIPVLYYPWKVDVDLVSPVKNGLEKISKYKKIGLITSINYINSLRNVRKFLEENGKSVFTYKGGKAEHEGQILGCDLASALRIEDKVDCFLYVGSGEFHSLGVALESSKPVFRVDIEERDIKKIDSEVFERQRMVAIGKAMDCKKFGILVSVKPGQLKNDLASRIKERLEQFDKKGYILSFDRITPEKLMGVEVDCYINTACPRIAIESRTEFKKPILNPEEFRKVVGKWRKGN